jgi:hypothetical protein
MRPRPDLPSLAIYRPAVGITDEHLQGLQAHLAQSDQLAGVNIAGMFPDASRLRAHLISRAEIDRVYDYTNRESSVEEMQKLGAYIMTALDKAAKKDGKEANGDIEAVPVLPSRLVAVKRSPIKILAVAKSWDVTDERDTAKKAVSEFTQRRLPNNIWFDDNYVVPLHLARSNDPLRAKIVTYLDLLLHAKGGFLPETVRLEPARPSKLPKL